jgi:hypothetical protein
LSSTTQQQHVDEKLPPMTKGRLVEIFEKSQRGGATLEDVIEIMSKMFLSQAQHQRAAQKREEDILAEITRLKKRLSLLEQFAGSPLYSTVLSDMGETVCDRCGDKIENEEGEGE